MLISSLLFFMTLLLLQKDESNPLWRNPSYPRKYAQYAMGWGILAMGIFGMASVQGAKAVMVLSEAISFIVLNIVFFSLQGYADQDSRNEMIGLYAIGLLTVVVIGVRFEMNRRASNKKELFELQSIFARVTA